MTMSVGLGKIINDPNASVRVRKALGALSTPGLLVHDTGLSIDDDGRIILRLDPNGGLTQDENGVGYNAPVTFGVDSFVNLDSDEHGNRLWNARLTGTAPNYFESGLAIGEEGFNGVSASGLPLDDALLAVTSKKAQMRLRYDEENFIAFRTLQEGTSQIFAVGVEEPGVHVFTGDGTYGPPEGGFRVNNGATLKNWFMLQSSLFFAGGGAAAGASWQEVGVVWVPTDSAYDIDPDTDVVTVTPANISGPGLPAQVLGWSGRITSTNNVAVRVSWWGVMAAMTGDWNILVHRMIAQP